ncbi:MAG: hypothetical protein II776_02865 [Clostridia bacterium]|nr:hypothetical protein [Clostridia bacterium]
MKRIKQAAALIISLCLLLSGCGQAIAPLSETAGSEMKETATAETRKNHVVLGHVTTWAEVEAIPVATPAMSEAELRQICVDFAVTQQRFQWYVDDDFSLECSWAKNGSITFSGATAYAGLPYSGGITPLYTLLDLQDETGRLDISAYTPDSCHLIGNNCASSLLWAWARVSEGVNFRGTPSLNTANGCVPAGPYECGGALALREHGTDLICRENGEQVMFASYAAMKPADGLIYFPQGAWYENRNVVGHVRMAVKDPVVAYRADGTIDGEQSFVTIVEQDSAKKETVDENGNPLLSQGRVDRELSFQALFKGNYVPFSMPELLGEKQAAEGRAVLDGAEGGLDAETLLRAEIESNYPMCRITAIFSDENGRETGRVVRRASTQNLERVYKVSGLFTKKVLQQHASETLELRAFLSNGQEIVVWQGSV